MYEIDLGALGKALGMMALLGGRGCRIQRQIQLISLLLNFYMFSPSCSLTRRGQPSPHRRLNRWGGSMGILRWPLRRSEIPNQAPEQRTGRGASIGQKDPDGLPRGGMPTWMLIKALVFLRTWPWFVRYVHGAAVLGPDSKYLHRRAHDGLRSVLVRLRGCTPMLSSKKDCSLRV